MADNFISGNDMYVKLGALAYSFNKWRIPIDGGVKKFFAAGSAAQRTLPGGYSASPVVEGPYNQGNMPLALNALYTLHLGWMTGIEIVLTARVANIEYNNAVSAGGDPGGCSVTFESDGDFGINFT